MCGILGICVRPEATLDVALLGRSLTSIRHRGPDDEGYLLVNGIDRVAVPFGGTDTDARIPARPLTSAEGGAWHVGLGHRRLSIIDVSPAGHQPMVGRDGSKWITFNGEIYNYRELRAQLQESGVKFDTESDTEVLLAAYQMWGTEMLPKLVGMFAFGIVDLAKGRILLARDSFGIKPLHYAVTKDGFAFASEIRALLKLPGVPRKVDPLAVYRYLRFGFTDGLEQSMFSGVRQLPAGSFAYVDMATATLSAPEKYWQIPRRPPIDVSFTEAQTMVREALEASVAFHLRSDVPLGACLSGGLDSTILVAMMREQMTRAQALHAFTFVTEDPKISEAQYVDLVQRVIPLESHRVMPSAIDIVRDLDPFMRAQEQPFSSTNMYAEYRVFQLAADAGIKVMLNGQGSDELFGGYYSAISSQVAGLLARGQLLKAVRLLGAGDFVMDGARMRILLSALGRFVPLPLASRIMSLAGEPLFADWMASSWFLERGVEGAPRPQGRGRHALQDELQIFTEELALPQLLRYQDRNSMAFSIEARVPFCNTALADIAFSLPPNYLVSPQGETKAVLREAVRGLVPTAIIDRPKVGFMTPERDWMAALDPWIRQTLDSEQAHAAGFLRQDRLSALVSDNASRKYFQSLLWRVLNLLHWARLFDVDLA